MGTSDRPARIQQATRLARGAADWMVDGVADCEDPSLYHGLAGIVLALQEAAQHFGDDRYQRAIADGVDVLIASVDTVEDSSL